jgi:hypothetical protein
VVTGAAAGLLFVLSELLLFALRVLVVWNSDTSRPDTSAKTSAAAFVPLAATKSSHPFSVTIFSSVMV